MFFSQSFHKIILGWKDRGNCYQHHHDLPCGKTSSHKHMAEKSVPGILVISLDLKGFQHSPNGTDNLLTLFVLDHTVIHRNNPVALLLINSGNNIALSVTSKSCMNFVSIIIRILHTNDWLNFAEFLQKSFCISLFFAKLFFIWYALITAATTLFRN